MLIWRINPFTGQQTKAELSVTQEQIDAWQSGQLIQVVMPQLNANEREFLISGVPIGEWDTIVTNY